MSPLKRAWVFPLTDFRDGSKIAIRADQVVELLTEPGKPPKVAPAWPGGRAQLSNAEAPHTIIITPRRSLYVVETPEEILDRLHEALKETP